MKPTFRLTAFALLFVILFTVPAYGWSDTGHMAVAYVAYQRLTPQTRARVDHLVSLNPKYNQWAAGLPSGTSAETRRLMLFMIAATWADQIKGENWYHSDGTHDGNRPPNDGTAARNIGYSDRARHKYWHFVDLPFSTDGTPLKNPPVPHARTQIDSFRWVLRSNVPDPLKSYDLVWLLHLVGDVHQPLHCAARFIHSQPEGDDGGNGVSVKDGQDTKRLHGFWDGLLGQTDDPQIAIQVGQGLPSAPAAAANNINTAAWINEGFGLARSRVYRFPIGPKAGPYTLNTDYRNQARDVARLRVAIAGARLAKILNSELR